MISENIIIKGKSTLKDALIQLNNTPHLQTLLVEDENSKIIGVLTDGDVRRGLIKGLSQSNLVVEYMSTTFIFLEKGKYEQIKIDTIRAQNIKIIPVLNTDGSLYKILNFNELKTILPIDAVIMAGGIGSRLMPLTKNTPKPMLKVGNKPIMDYNIDLLKSFGVHNITLSVKYLKNVIIDYYNSRKDLNIDLNYVTENEPLGTIGAVKQIKKFHNNYILVMNSDLLTNIDLEAMFKTLISQNADMIVASTNYKVQIPYGVIETKDHKVERIVEKPTYTYYTSAGIYIFKRELIDLIPSNSFFNATDLLDKLFELKKTVAHYPIKKYWLDIGNHVDFEKANDEVGNVSF
jgi:dTDP-glucose pyrophosphorylase